MGCRLLLFYMIVLFVHVVHAWAARYFFIYLPVLAFRVAGGVATGLWLMVGFSPTFDVSDLTSYSFCILNTYHLLNRHAGGIFTPNPSSCHLSAHQTRRQSTHHAISSVVDQ